MPAPKAVETPTHKQCPACHQPDFTHAIDCVLLPYTRALRLELVAENGAGGRSPRKVPKSVEDTLLRELSRLQNIRVRLLEPLRSALRLMGHDLAYDHITQIGNTMATAEGTILEALGHTPR